MVRSFALTAGCDDGWMDGWVPSASNEEGALAKAQSSSTYYAYYLLCSRIIASITERAQKSRDTDGALSFTLENADGRCRGHEFRSL